MPDVIITEVAMRDGLQNESTIVSTETKLNLTKRLLACGFSSLELGAFVRADRVPQMADTDDLFAKVDRPDAVTWHALAFNPIGAERAIDSDAESIRVVLSASDGHSRSNAGADSDEALARLRPTIEMLQAASIPVEASIATAFVCPFDGPTPPSRIAELVSAFTTLGISRIHLADTIGAAHPDQIGQAIVAATRAAPTVELGLHLHNTYGMALANALEGYRSGVRRFDTAVGGVGGCPFAPGAAGNIATDDLVNMFHQLGIDTGIDPGRLVNARDALRDALDRDLDSALFNIPAAPAPRPSLACRTSPKA